MPRISLNREEDEEANKEKDEQLKALLTYPEIILKDILAAKELQLKEENESGSWAVPDELLCPFTDKIIDDLITLANGQDLLANNEVIPNHFAQKIISRLCSNKQPNCNPIFEVEQKVLDSLFNNLASSSIFEKMQSAYRVLMLSCLKASIKAFIKQNRRAISDLLSVTGLEEDRQALLIVVRMFNHIGLLGEITNGLIRSLGSSSPKMESSATLSLYHVTNKHSFNSDSNRKMLGEMGAIGPLILNMKNGDSQLKADTLTVLLNLCIDDENSERAVEGGAVVILIEMLKRRIWVDGVLGTLVALSKHERAAKEIVASDGMLACLFSIMQMSDSETMLGNVAAIVHSICVIHKVGLGRVCEEESSSATIRQLLDDGKLSEQTRAQEILEEIRKAKQLVHS